MNSGPGAIGALVEHSWHIMEHITRGPYPLGVKTSAFHLYLNVCGVVTATSDHTCLSKLPSLANYVERVVQTLLQYSGSEFRSTVKFGSGSPNLFGYEFGVSGLQLFPPTVRSGTEFYVLFVFSTGMGRASDSKVSRKC